MSNSDKHRILIVDDNLANRELMEAYLAEVDCEMKVAEDGQQAVDMAASFEPDLIFAIDIGIEAAQL